MIDYEALLRKYIAHVIDCEGWSFLECGNYGLMHFTGDELAELRRIAGVGETAA